MNSHLSLELLELFFLLLSVFLYFLVRFRLGILYPLRTVWRYIRNTMSVGNIVEEQSGSYILWLNYAIA
jgi:hypothetical protein